SAARALVEERDHVLLVACIDDTVVGYASAHVEHRPETAFRYPRTSLCIQWMGVRASARRQGVGRALLRALRALAADRDIPALELEVWAFNVEASAFYKAVGFEAQRQVLSMELCGDIRAHTTMRSNEVEILAARSRGKICC